MDDRMMMGHAGLGSGCMMSRSDKKAELARLKQLVALNEALKAQVGRAAAAHEGRRRAHRGGSTSVVEAC